MGTAYVPGNTIGSSLYLPTGRHTIFAAKDGRYAVQSVQVGRGGIRRLNLIYVPMTGSLSEAEITRLRKVRDWTGILLATSDGRLHAKAPGLAYAHAEAMNGLKLGEWIDLNDLREVSATERRRVESWLRISQPLWSWR